MGSEINRSAWNVIHLFASEPWKNNHIGYGCLTAEGMDIQHNVLADMHFSREERVRPTKNYSDEIVSSQPLSS